MAHFVGLDVSVKETSVCVVDDTGKAILEQKVPTEPADIIALLSSLGVTYGRIGIEAGPLSQWLVNALTAAELPVICVETRHMKALLTAQQINKTDRNDARGIAQMMRVGLFKPVHVKTLVAQEQRMLLTSRKLLQRKLLDVESDLRGTLRNFGLKVGVVGGSRYEARVRELVEGFLFAIERHRDLVAAPGEPTRQHVPVHLVVFDDQDFRHLPPPQVVGANSVTLGNRTNICLSTCARSSAPFAITSRARPANSARSAASNGIAGRITIGMFCHSARLVVSSKNAKPFMPGISRSSRIM